MFTLTIFTLNIYDAAIMQKLIDLFTTKLDEIKFCGTILETYERLIALIF